MAVFILGWGSGNGCTALNLIICGLTGFESANIVDMQLELFDSISNFQFES